MTKRKSKTTAEFKPPTRAQPRAKRQKSTEETNLRSADENQTPKSENNNSHNASCSEKLDEHQSEQSTLQICQTTEIPVDPCSLEEKTSDDVDGNDTNPPAVSYENEKTVEIAVQTPNPNNSDKYTLSIPSNVDVTNENQPDVELNNEKSEITSNSNHESQKVLDDCDSELPSDESQTKRGLSHEERKATEPKMGEGFGSSDIAETLVDETGIQKTEDPLVKRKVKKRMGMCRLGERKRMLKGQLTSGNVFGGQETETGQDINVMSDDLKKDDQEEEGTTESEASGSFFPTPCPLEDIPVREEQEQPDVQVQVQVESMTSKQEITHETDNTSPSLADPLEETETECVELGTNESNVREDKPEMCADVTTEIGTELTVDLAEVCKETNPPQDVVVIEGPLEALKETTESSTSTSEAANHFEELLGVGGNEMEVEECKCDMNTSVSADTDEQGVELKDIAASETVNALPVIEEREDKCESLDCTLVAVTGEKTVNCEDRSMWSLPLPAAQPCGEDKEVQSVTECDAQELDPSPAAEPDPSSQSSVLSVTDSQLNNIPLSLEDFLLSEAACDLEDATERVCGLIRDLAFLNQKLRDAHRRIGFQQGRNPPRPPFRSKYGPPH